MRASEGLAARARRIALRGGFRTAATARGDGASVAFAFDPRWATPAFWAEVEAVRARRIRIWGERFDIPRPTPWDSDVRTGTRWSVTKPARRLPIAWGDGSDIKFPWELGRMAFLPALAVAAALKPSGPWGECACEWIDDFVESNPVGFGVQWRVAMEAALRGVNIAIALRVMSDAGLPLEPGLRAKIARAIREHGRFIAAEIEGPGLFASNHYVSNLYGLAVIACLHPEFPESAAWRAFASRELEREIARQTGEDGGHFEASLAYHRFVLEMFAIAGCWLELAGEHLSPAFWARLRAMFAFAAVMRQPDGWAPQIGDNDSGFALALTPRASLDWSGLETFASWVFGPSAAQFEAPGWFVAPEFGLFVARRGDVHATLRAGPVGLCGKGSHAHNDSLAVTLFWGEPLLVDPGSFVYTGDLALRDEFRGARSHNTVTVDGRDQNQTERSFPFLLRDRARARFVETFPSVAVAEHTGYAPVVHRRTLSVGPGPVVEIADRLSGTGRHTIESSLHFAPSCGVERGVRPNGWVVSSPWRSWSIDGRLPEGFEAAIERGWFSPEYGSRVPAFVLRMRGKVALPCDLVVRVTT